MTERIFPVCFHGVILPLILKIKSDLYQIWREDRSIIRSPNAPFGLCYNYMAVSCTRNEKYAI